jgi:hypothetical protein
MARVTQHLRSNVGLRAGHDSGETRETVTALTQPTASRVCSQRLAVVMPLNTSFCMPLLVWAM